MELLKPTKESLQWKVKNVASDYTDKLYFQLDSIYPNELSIEKKYSDQQIIKLKDKYKFEKVLIKF